MPIRGVALTVTSEDEQFRVLPDEGGRIELLVSPGIYHMQISEVVGRSWFVAGWYDGEGSITALRRDATRVIVTDQGLEGIEIEIPAFEEGELCLSGYPRSFISGRCDLTLDPPPAALATPLMYWPELPPIELRTNSNYYRQRDFRLTTDVRNAITEFGYTMPEIASKIEGFPWIEDGIRWGAEGDAAIALLTLANRGYAEPLVYQSWAIEGSNFPALKSLSSFLRFGPVEFGRYINSGIFTDGISGRDAKIAAVLNPGYERQQLKDLIDPELVSVEVRQVTLPLAGDIELSIVRTRPGAPETMDLLEEAVRRVEEFMGLPFPERQVILWVHPGLERGATDGTHIAIGLDELTGDKETLLGLMSRGASRYYWKDFQEPQNWIEEGAASFIEALAKEYAHGRIDTEPCAVVRSIAELEVRANSLQAHSFVLCAVSLGGRLYSDLYHSLDITLFRQAFRRLSLRNRYLVDLSVRCYSDVPTICHVRDAFFFHADKDADAVVKKVINRWYEGAEPFGPSEIDGTPVDIDIEAIEGRIEKAYISSDPGGNAHSTVSVRGGIGTVPYLNLFYTYANSAALESLPIEITLTYEDGFEFRRIPTELPLAAGKALANHAIALGRLDALGNYILQAYWGEQKIAEVGFEVVE